METLQCTRSPDEMQETANAPLYQLAYVHKTGERQHEQQAKNKVDRYMLAKYIHKIQLFSAQIDQKHKPIKEIRNEKLTRNTNCDILKKIAIFAMVH